MVDEYAGDWSYGVCHTCGVDPCRCHTPTAVCTCGRFVHAPWCDARVREMCTHLDCGRRLDEHASGTLGCPGLATTYAGPIGGVYGPSCGATYPVPVYIRADGVATVFTCGLVRGHAGSHEDRTADAPSTVAWR